MVINLKRALQSRRQAAALSLELVIAMAILATVIFPLAFSFIREQKLCRAYYFQAVAMELIDGEMEVLAAGEWQRFEPGVHPYAITRPAATNLPSGQFLLTVTNDAIALEWTPAKRGKGGRISREVKIIQHEDAIFQEKKAD